MLHLGFKMGPEFLRQPLELLLCQACPPFLYVLLWDFPLAASLQQPPSSTHPKQ